jgi:hypothetical protein
VLAQEELAQRSDATLTVQDTRTDEIVKTVDTVVSWQSTSKSQSTLDAEGVEEGDLYMEGSKDVN